MPISSRKLAANRSNARRSTGPRTAEGKTRASQNARKRPFNPDPFTIVRIEDRDRIAALVTDAVATYQPSNSQERVAVERIALAQHSIYRLYALEAGFFSNCLDQAMCRPEDANLLERSELSKGIEPAVEQHQTYWLAFGFNRYNRQSNITAALLRFQAQAERLYRRAVEDFHRLLKLRDKLPPEKYVENEPTIEPRKTPQIPQRTTAFEPDDDQPETPNEAIANPPEDDPEQLGPQPHKPARDRPDSALLYSSPEP
jgi:hypothetical protein